MTRQPPLDRGQAAVELALVLPVVAMLALGVAQVAVVAAHQLAVLHAARDAARAASVDADAAGAAQRAAHQATALRPLSVSAAVDGDLVTVTVSHRAPTDLPLVGPLLPDVVLSARVTMARDPPAVDE
jgi:Flp pilus assembly protein TadG